MRRKIIAGNWKMNTTPAEGIRLAEKVAAEGRTVQAGTTVVIAPPFTHLAEAVRTMRGSGIAVAAQNCASETAGAYTGEVSAGMIASLGVEYVIIGHSERRHYFGEDSMVLRRKVGEALANNLAPIFCVGESLAERESGKAFEVVMQQVEEVLYGVLAEAFPRIIVAYEPVWAIGTGKTATAAQAQQMHKHIRDILAGKFGKPADSTPILYGGSVKASNAAELFTGPDVDGALVGGASLDADEFMAIVRSI